VAGGAVHRLDAAKLDKQTPLLWEIDIAECSVDSAALLRNARQAAGLTQLELARRCETAQPAVAAYESGARKPNIGTLQRLLEGCDYEVELVARPRVRRGAASLSQLAETMRKDLAGGDEQAALRLLLGFADDFRGSSRAGRIALIGEEPGPTGDARFDALLAGAAKFFAAEGVIPVPRWVNGAVRFVEPWWFVASRPAFHAYTLANTPAVFARHGVFIAREVFDRA
jgi:transcriptional regulator with XRE-family HTH domain